MEEQEEAVGILQGGIPGSLVFDITAAIDTILILP